MSIAALARREIRELKSYRTTAAALNGIKLNANEAARSVDSDSSKGMNRYPEIRPLSLTSQMAGHYGVEPENVLITRGSSEGIDLLIRTFCAAARDNVLSTPPTFEMYRTYADIQGIEVIEVPLLPQQDFAIPTRDLLDACTQQTKLIFLSTPNNPAGNVIPRTALLKILEARAGKSVVVIDEAYIEYSEQESMASQVSEYDNLVVLRTLSKAMALAGARCGAVIAPRDVTALLNGVLAPYALATPVIASAELAMSRVRLANARSLIQETIAERERLRTALGESNVVRKIWPSEANFLLVEFSDFDGMLCRLDDVGITVRTFANDPLLKNCMRITVGLEDDNNQLIKLVRSIA